MSHDTELSSFIDKCGVYQGPEILTGNLVLSATDNLISLGCLKEVRGSLSLFTCSKLSSLGSLQKVTGAMDLVGCANLITLGDLREVGRYLDLGGSLKLKSLGNVETVGGTLYTPYSSIIDYGALRCASTLYLRDGAKLPYGVRFSGLTLMTKSLSNITELKYGYREFCEAKETVSRLSLTELPVYCLRVSSRSDSRLVSLMVLDKIKGIFPY